MALNYLIIKYIYQMKKQKRSIKYPTVDLRFIKNCNLSEWRHRNTKLAANISDAVRYWVENNVKPGIYMHRSTLSTQWGQIIKILVVPVSVILKILRIENMIQ